MPSSTDSIPCLISNVPISTITPRLGIVGITAAFSSLMDAPYRGIAGLNNLVKAEIRICIDPRPTVDTVWSRVLWARHREGAGMSNVTIDQLMPSRFVSSVSLGRLRSYQPPRIASPQNHSASVAWGDLTCVPADLHVIGHHRGVTATGAEQALDFAIPGPTVTV